MFANKFIHSYIHRCMHAFILNLFSPTINGLKKDSDQGTSINTAIKHVGRVGKNLVGALFARCWSVVGIQGMRVFRSDVVAFLHHSGVEDSGK